MTPSRKRRAYFAISAAGAAIVVFALALDHSFYAPGAWDFHWEFLDNWRNSTPYHHHELNIFYLVRKVYSILAFSILGLLVAPAVPKRRRILLDALVVGGLSTLIEIAQKVTGSWESFGSNLFDIGCGAAGGVIGALTWNLTRALARRFARN